MVLPLSEADTRAEADRSRDSPARLVRGHDLPWNHPRCGRDHREDGDPSFLFRHYPEHYFSHIVIDECHRSAWGKWSVVLTRNPNGRPDELRLPHQRDTGAVPTARHPRLERRRAVLTSR